MMAAFFSNLSQNAGLAMGLRQIHGSLRRHTRAEAEIDEDMVQKPNILLIAEH
jgi:hypothetical protein